MDMPNLEIIKTLQETERFLVQKAIFNNQVVVLKKAKTKKMITNLHNELQAYNYYDEILKTENGPFTIASLIASGDDWIIESFLDGKPMRELINDDNRDEHYETLVKIMAFCDNKIKVHLNNSNLGLPSFVIDEARRRLIDMRERFKVLSDSKITFDQKLLATAADAFEAGISDLATCFVNPDLTTSHVMINGEVPAIFDFENAKLQGARFSDLINMMTKIWFKNSDKRSAMNFYSSFWKNTNLQPEDYSDQLRTLVMIRCVGFTDELITEPNQYHNTKLKLSQNLADNITDVINWGHTL